MKGVNGTHIFEAMWSSDSLLPKGGAVGEDVGGPAGRAHLQSPSSVGARSSSPPVTHPAALHRASFFTPYTGERQIQKIITAVQNLVKLWSSRPLLQPARCWWGTTFAWSRKLVLKIGALIDKQYWGCCHICCFAENGLSGVIWNLGRAL